MRIISLNIRQGGGRRDRSILEWIFAQNPDALVLSEWRNNDAGLRMQRALKENRFFLAIALKQKANGLLIAAKDPLESNCMTPKGSKTGQLLMVKNLFGFNLLGAYFPNLSAKIPFFRTCMKTATASQTVPFALVGDLNTGNNDLDREPSGVRFHCANLFDALQSQAGLIDLWRREHGDRQEWSWKSQQKNGFRIDHIFANTLFIKRFSSIRCRYDAGPPSDHKALIVDCDS